MLATLDLVCRPFWKDSHGQAQSSVSSSRYSAGQGCSCKCSLWSSLHSVSCHQRKGLTPSPISGQFSPSHQLVPLTKSSLVTKNTKSTCVPRSVSSLDTAVISPKHPQQLKPRRRDLTEQDRRPGLREVCFTKVFCPYKKKKIYIVDFSLAPKVMLLAKTTNSNTFASKGFLNLLQIPSSCLRGNCVQASDKIMQAYQNTLFPLLIWLSLATWGSQNLATSKAQQKWKLKLKSFYF